MRIVCWNCNGAFRKKFHAVQALYPDIAIIQECEDPSQTLDREYKTWASNYLWCGPSKNRGVGVFARQDISLKLVELDVGSLELFLPCVVNDKLALLAVWTREANSPTFRYIGQLWKFLQLHSDFLRQEHAALIGDLNSNSRWDVWDRWWNHSDVVSLLHALGLESLYHNLFREPQGNESVATFYFRRHRQRPYHIDYAFLSGNLSEGASLAIGEPEYWLEMSDHMPLNMQINNL